MTEERKKELIREAHELAKEKGWWDEPRTNEECFALILSEACEALEADRKGHRASMGEYNRMFRDGDPREFVGGVHVGGFQAFIKDTVEDELADIAIRTFDLAGWVVPKAHHSDGTMLLGWDAPGQKLWISRSENPIFQLVTEMAHLQVCAAGLEYGRCAWEEVPESSRFDDVRMVVVCQFATRLVFEIAHQMNIDLWRHIELKMAYNKTRGHKHGKNY